MVTFLLFTDPLWSWLAILLVANTFGLLPVVLAGGDKRFSPAYCKVNDFDRFIRFMAEHSSMRYSCEILKVSSR